MRYLRRLSPESLRYQPEMSTALPDVLRSSIQSLRPEGELARTSLVTTACWGAGAADSSSPGVPRSAVEACQAADEFQVRGSAVGSLMTREAPLPSVWGYQSWE